MKQKLQMPRFARLTLSEEVFKMAHAKKSPIAGMAAQKRPDGKWDCMVKSAVFLTIKQMAEPQNENLSDTCRRILF